MPPSVPDGQRFVFDQKPSSEAAPAGSESASDALPVVVVAQQLPHPLYARVGDGFDISHTARVPLVKALCGTVLSLRALDGRQLSIPVPETIPCGATKTLEGLGLPRGDGSFGSLVVQFDHVFPKSVSDTQKTLLRAAFFLPKELNKEQAARYFILCQPRTPPRACCASLRGRRERAGKATDKPHSTIAAGGGEGVHEGVPGAEARVGARVPAIAAGGE